MVLAERLAPPETDGADGAAGILDEVEGPAMTTPDGGLDRWMEVVCVLRRDVQVYNRLLDRAALRQDLQNVETILDGSRQADLRKV